MMRDILFVSRWFYPGGASILEWLAVCTLAALAAVALSRIVSGSGKKLAAAAGSALCVAGGLICAAMILAEILVFEFTVPLAAAAYAVLAGSFACLFSQLWTKPLIRAMCVESIALAVAAFGYLFFYGAVPPIVELRAGVPDRQGMNVLGDRPGTLAITEFADFECPPCATQDAIMDKVWAAYSDRITYSFRHFPKARHPHAEPAAVMSQCAAESGAFWKPSVSSSRTRTVSPISSLVPNCRRFPLVRRSVSGSVSRRDRPCGASPGIGSRRRASACESRRRSSWETS